jgi:glycosyltransferase involved in cell wall biosynthesis
MRILSVHNFYQQPGGEDAVFAAEAALLAGHGHQVRQYTRSNAEIGPKAGLATAIGTVWSREACEDLRAAVHFGRPEVCHIHNFFPLVSPAVYRAVRGEGARVVQTLHNYRLLCPGASLFRDGRVCESCLGKWMPWRGVEHACYRDSRLASGSVAAMLALHHALGTWQEEVDCYIALTEFARRKFIEGGLPEDRIVVKPNFVDPDPGVGDGGGGFVLFAGRLAVEKDAATLIRAAARLGGRIQVKIAGDGPERERLVEMARGLGHVEFLGRQPAPEVRSLMKQAALLVVPSAWFEGFPMVIAEAFATGLPVVASRLGALAEIVADGRTGRLFEAGDDEELAAVIERLLADANALGEMRRQARAEYEARYTAERNYGQLMAIYDRVTWRNN